MNFATPLCYSSYRMLMLMPISRMSYEQEVFYFRSLCDCCFPYIVAIKTIDMELCKLPNSLVFSKPVLQCLFIHKWLVETVQMTTIIPLCINTLRPMISDSL